MRGGEPSLRLVFVAVLVPDGLVGGDGMGDNAGRGEEAVVGGVGGRSVVLCNNCNARLETAYFVIFHFPAGKRIYLRSGLGCQFNLGERTLPPV